MINVYKIVNKLNGIIYIGQTQKNLDIRFKEHCKKTNGCTYLRNAIQKHEKNNFSISLLGIYPSRLDADDAEQYFIDFYNSLAPNGYNLTSGGNSRKEFSIIAKEKLSLARKGQHNSPRTEFKAGPRPHACGVNNTMYGRASCARKTVKIIETNEKFPSITHLAKYLAVSRSYVSRLLSGKSRGKTVKGYTVTYEL